MKKKRQIKKTKQSPPRFEPEENDIGGSHLIQSTTQTSLDRQSNSQYIVSSLQ